LFRVFNRRKVQSITKTERSGERALLRKNSTVRIDRRTSGIAAISDGEKETPERSSKRGLVSESGNSTSQESALKEKVRKGITTDDSILAPKKEGSLFSHMREARKSSDRVRRVQHLAAQSSSTAQPAPQQMPFITKIRAAAKAAAKKAAAGALIGTLATTGLAGGYVALDQDTASIWYPIKAGVTVDGSNEGTPLTQDVVTKMFARLAAYGVNTSYNTESTAGPLTIHIPGYEAWSSDVRW